MFYVNLKLKFNIMTEEFRRYNERLEVSDEGNVKVDGKPYDISKSNTVYKRVLGHYVHRMVAELFIPNPENKPYVDHIDGNRYNNKVMIIELKEKIDITKYIKDKRNLYYISSFNYDYISYLNKSVYYKLGVINYILNSGIDYSKIDFIMVLDSVYNKKLFKLKDIEIIIYGVIGNINSYNKELKYIV